MGTVRPAERLWLIVGGPGVLGGTRSSPGCVVPGFGNYAGDVLHFAQAAERLRPMTSTSAWYRSATPLLCDWPSRWAHLHRLCQTIGVGLTDSHEASTKHGRILAAPETYEPSRGLVRSHSIADSKLDDT